MSDPLRDAIFAKWSDTLDDGNDYVCVERAGFDLLVAEIESAPLRQPSAGEPVAEDFCGVLQECSERETRAGTKYSVCKWACPTCHSACSVLYIDDEWCHGDSLTIEFVGGAKTIKCGKCWLSATPPAPTGDGHD